MTRRARFDAIVVGSGLAGMMTALELALARPRLRRLNVAIVSHGTLGERTSSAWAQGGIAAALGDDDTPALHAADTVAAGAGLVERRVAARLAADAPHAIERIASLGVRFDRDDATHYALGREAAHSRRRILKAGGDATGAELVRAIARAVRDCANVTLFEGARALDVVCAGRAVCGLVVRDAGGSVVTLGTPAVVLATGGLGGLYRFTTNPTSSRGSGIAIAARAGARLADLEFVQFHPTALDVASDPLPLVTEALRGEGALLLDECGARIMTQADPGRELAPRDIVARRVFAVAQRGGQAYLDARAALADTFPLRFPTVFAACERFHIDPRTQPIPVVAAAHYHMGGVAVDLEGRTNVPGLYACGEVAAGGVHGANRLASNSLLESVVYPERIARDIGAYLEAAACAERAAHEIPEHPQAAGAAASLAPRCASASVGPAAFDAIREEMYRNVGVERDEAGLRRAVGRLRELGEAAASEEVRDAALVGEFVARSALRRRETRGSHVRTDYPQPATSQRHRSFYTLAERTTGLKTA